jgi:hypothetical protein
MAEDIQTGIVNEFFQGGWRVAPFIKTQDGYIGVKAWPKRAASNARELQVLIDEQSAKSAKTPILGIVPSRGKYVVDIDTKKNGSALQLWKDKVVEVYGDVKLAVPDLVVKTKSGGYHLYYSDGSDRQLHSPTSVFNKESGIDIRGYTGMVIAPTSIGTEEDWQLGDYVIVRGRPTDPLTVLGLGKIIGESYDEVDGFIKSLLHQVNEALRNDTVPEIKRHRLLPDSLIIPSSNRDNTLYRCARLCRLAGLSQDAALLFMQHVSARCETSDTEPTEHWIKLGADKVRRVYASETEMQLQAISSFYDELDNAGAVLLRGVSKSYYYFRHGSTMLRIEPRSRFGTENMANVLQGISIHGDDGEIPVKKVIGGYNPRYVAYNAAMYPKSELPFYEFEGNKYVNTYHDPFASFEPDLDLMERAKPYVLAFLDYAKHITGYREGDDAYLLDKLAWIVQKPYRRLPTGTIIYSQTRGSGKDLFMSLVREIVGRQFYAPITLSSIESEFHSFHDKIVCTVSEVQLQANARGTIAAASFMGRIKDIITAKTIQVNEKFQQPYTSPIFTNFFILSNFELSPILEPGDRRFDIFHTTEEKFDQAKYGDLADLTNDGLWLERSQADRNFRHHCIFALRRMLQDREIDKLFDREEAKMNEVKKELVETQSPPAVEWLYHNLPNWFTDDVVMMACHFCPLKISPEYAMKKLKEQYGVEMRLLYRSGRSVYRLNGSPRYEIRDSGAGRIPTLVCNIPTTDKGSKKSVYTFQKLQDVNPSDTAIAKWFESMTSRYYGNVTTLPNQKPDGGGTDILN